MTLSTPANTTYFIAGERPVATIRLSNRCGQTLSVSDVSTANLYLYGPRGAFAQTASQLLNCVVDRNATDHQHHFINLAAPDFFDASQNNLAVAADGTSTFTFAPVSNEVGTYTVAVWAKNNADADQVFVTADLQLGNAAAESYADGASTSSTCFACHRTPGDSLAQMTHSHPSSFSPAGNWALDELPTASCKACHNVDGYSRSPLVAKVHGLHRGAHQLNPGVAHPEYALAADTTLYEYVNVLFPSMPGAEKDCTLCHADDRWKLQPSRLGCGTCHDNLFFDTGLFNPPRSFGKPTSGSCFIDADCASFGSYAVCDTGTGSCVHQAHPIETDDTTCTQCHDEGPTATSPVSAAHEIYADTRGPGLQLSNANVSGASLPGAFQAGDTPSITFTLVDRTGNPVTDLKTAPNPNPYTAFALVSGPAAAPQRLLGPLTISLTGSSLVANGGGSYTYTFPAAIPSGAQSPFNTTLAGPSPIATGTYTAFVYLTKSVTYNGESFLDAASAAVDFSYVAGQGDPVPPVQPRQLISTSACNACHRDVQAHQGALRNDAEQCATCHTRDAVDRGIDVPSTGQQCIVGSTVCPTYQTCTAPPSGAPPPKAPNDGYCVLTSDPTPANSIEFSQLIHNIHFARLRGGYAERNFLSLYAGVLVFVGALNTIEDTSQALFSEDVRNCVECHASAGNGCTSDAQCGVGQQCVSAACANTGWQRPSTRACISCHDTASATGHAALNTWSSPDGPVETCDACHGTQADFSVARVHSIRNPYVPPYAR